MKGSMPRGAPLGGDMGFPSGKGVNINARNIRRLIKKFPHDPVFQEILREHLKKYEGDKS